MAVEDTNLLDCIFQTADLATEKQPCHCPRGIVRVLSL